MSTITIGQGATWAIAALTTGCIIVRPWRLPEALWAILGAIGLVVLSLLPWRDALRAVGSGADVYLFLAGMMILAELARQQGVFDWLAARTVRLARGSARHLFALVFAVGTLGTTFLSNDATARVLTSAVFPLHLRLRGKRGELRAADLQSRKRGPLWQPHACTRLLVVTVRPSLPDVDRSNVPCAALHPTGALA